MNETDFGFALKALRAGEKVSRKGWNGKGMWVALHKPNAGRDILTQPFIFIKSIDDSTIPWHPSQSDVLAYDWDIVSD